MIKGLKMILLLLAAASSLVIAPKAMAAASTNPLDKACVSNTNASGSAVCNQAAGQGTTNPIAGPNGIISKAANIIAIVAGIGAVVVMVIAGYMFVTAGGASPGQRSADPNRLKTARAALSGAIIGLVVIALAWAIVKFVTGRLVQ